jgi:PAS domain S-box-containing protein
MLSQKEDVKHNLQNDGSIFEATPGIRFLTLPDVPTFTIVAVSAEFCKTFSIDRQSLLGKRASDLVRPFDKPVTAKAGSIHSLGVALKSKSHQQLEKVALTLHLNGSEAKNIYCDVMSTPVLDEEGNVKYIILCFENIVDTVKGRITSVGFTKRKLREMRNRLEQTFSIETVGVIYFDLQGRITDANPAFEKMSGYSKAEFLSGQVRWDKLTPPEFMDVTLISLNEFLSQWKNTPYEKQYVRPDGSKWWGLFAGKRLSENECVEFVVDISALKQIEADLENRVQLRTQELEKVNTELVRSNQNLEQFAYAASHDMKEPLRKILLFTDRLRGRLNGQLGDEENQFFNRLVDATKRMSTLIDDLLTYSHATFQPRSMEEVDLDDLLKQVLHDLDVQIEECKANIKIDKLCVLKGNYRQLQQAFQNLISNALKYSKPDIAPEIYISCEKESKNSLPGEYYLIQVKDNGVGFEQQDAERIFDVFTRLHSAEVSKGSGVGLSIVRKVVENHNGFVRALSKEGEGSTFQLYFPSDQIIG